MTAEPLIPPALWARTLGDTALLREATGTDRYATLDSLRDSPATKRAAAVLEVAKRLTRGEAFERNAMGAPAAVASYLALRYGVRDQEVMGALYLDTRHRLISEKELYRGTINRAAVEPRAILREGLIVGASGLVVWHTHPSGDPSPSAEDLAFTRRLAEGGEIVGIRLVDHLILGSMGRFVSLREHGAW